MTAEPLTVLVERLESAEVLDGAASALGREIRELIPDGPPKDALSGRWLGHAVHPVLTDVPIGMWTSAVLLDWTGGRASRPAADRLLVVGLLAAAATVATGWCMPRRMRPRRLSCSAPASRACAAPADAAGCWRSADPPRSASAAGSADT